MKDYRGPGGVAATNYPVATAPGSVFVFPSNSSPVITAISFCVILRDDFKTPAKTHPLSKQWRYPLDGNNHKNSGFAGYQSDVNRDNCLCGYRPAQTLAGSA